MGTYEPESLQRLVDELTDRCIRLLDREGKMGGQIYMTERWTVCWFQMGFSPILEVSHRHETVFRVGYPTPDVERQVVDYDACENELLPWLRNKQVLEDLANI